MTEPTNEFAKEFTEEGFWDKLARYARTAGREVIEKVLWLWYAFKSAETPAWAKTIIVGALGYFISPLDAIPDLVPAVGYSDDLGVLALAVATVAAYITNEVRLQAQEKMKNWFGE